MKYQEILDRTFQNLPPLFNCKGKWETHTDRELDARVTLNFPDGSFLFNTEVKMEV